MQASYLPAFEREMGCTEAEWVGWLPRAFGTYWPTDGGAAAAVAPLLAGGVASRLVTPIDGGQLTLNWSPLPPRRLGLAVLPRLWVRFEFSGLTEPQRHAFMKRFDLYTQRGGG